MVTTVKKLHLLPAVLVGLLLLYAAIPVYNGLYYSTTVYERRAHLLQDTLSKVGNNCNLSFAPKHTLPMTALASFPGSGNTWTRHLLQQATGIYTGNVNSGTQLTKGVFPGDRDDFRLGTTLTQKTHSKDISFMNVFDSAILLVRNPYQALLAEFNRQQAGKTGIADKSKFSGDDWSRYVAWKSPRWYEHVSTWLEFNKPLLVINFNDLTNDTIREVRKMVEFLGLKLTPTRERCLINDMDGMFKRKKKKAAPKDPFSPDMHTIIDKYIASVNQILKEKNNTEL